MASTIFLTPVCSDPRVSACVPLSDLLNIRIVLMGAGAAAVTINTFEFALISVHLNDCCCLEI